MSDIPRLAAELAERMESLGYSKGIVRIVRKCGRELEDARMRYGLSRRSLGKVIDRYADEWRERWNRREVSHTRYTIRIKAVERMLAIHQGREPLWSQTPKPQIVSNDYYERLAVEIGGLPHWTSESLARGCQSTARALFAWLYENGHEDLRSVAPDDIRKFYLQKAARVVNVHHLRYTLRQACDILTASGRLRCRCDKIFGLAISSEMRLMPCLTSDEVDRILNAPDRSRPVGKRDFAMLILGATTGLRACDVASLKLDDIDWRKGELRVVQRKTSVGLSLPLTEGVGCAMRDYILNGRPQSECREIFLRSSAPFGKIDRGTVAGVFAEMRRRAGIRTPKLGFHAFRRTLGMLLVSGEVDAPTISQVLGHTALASAERYIRADETSLSECALGLAGIRYGGICGMNAEFCFADAVESMMEFRRSVGLSDRATKSMAAMFAEYCAEKPVTTPLLTKDVAEGWLGWESGRGRRGLPQKATFLRLLARFINATGGSAYELPVACTPKPAGFSPHVFTDDELSMLFAEIDRYEDARGIVPHCTYPVLFRTIYTCGLRPGEGFSIRISDVDLSSGRIFIRAAKRHKERIVVASEDMRRMLARFASMRGTSDSQLLFPRTDGNMIGRCLANDVFRRCWARACRKARVTNPARVRVYDLRHRFASAVLQRWQGEGRDIQAMIPRLRTYMGHEHIESTLYYAHLLPERLSARAGADWSGLEQLIPEVADEND